MKNSEEDASRWVRQAENDLAVAQLTLREGFFAQACFMSHQLAGKSLKALAYRRGDRYVTGHCVTDFVRDLEQTYPEVSEHDQLAGILDQILRTYSVPRRPAGKCAVRGV